MNIKMLMGNVVKTKNTIFVMNTVYDGLCEVMKQYGIEWRVRCTTPQYYNKIVIYIHEVEIRCTKEEYEALYAATKEVGLGGGMSFPGYGVKCR